MHGGTGFDQAGLANRAVKIMYLAAITRWQRKGYDDDVVREESVFSFLWTGRVELGREQQLDIMLAVFLAQMGGIAKLFLPEINEANSPTGRLVLADRRIDGSNAPFMRPHDQAHY